MSMITEIGKMDWTNGKDAIQYMVQDGRNNEFSVIVVKKNGSFDNAVVTRIAKGCQRKSYGKTFYAIADAVKHYKSIGTTLDAILNK